MDIEPQGHIGPPPPEQLCWSLSLEWLTNVDHVAFEHMSFQHHVKSMH